MDITSQSVNLRELWDSRERVGLLPVLERMNELLDSGLITQDEFR